MKAVKTRYGGIKGMGGRKTGFFHVEQLDGRYWFIDPDGGAFFANGLCRVGYHSTKDPSGRDVYYDNVSKVYPTEQDWARHVRKRLETWGCNTNVPDVGALHGPCASWCPASRTFGQMKSRLRGPGVPGYMTFVDIFDPAWPKTYAKVCNEMARPKKDDKSLIGYFTDNELFWGTAWYWPHSLLDGVMHQEPACFNKQELVRFLRDRHGSVAAFNAAWGTELTDWPQLLELRDLKNFNDAILADKKAWLFHYARHYFRTVDTQLKKADPNHLNLGPRVHGWIQDELALAMGEFLDVVSFNKYDGIAPQFQMTETIAKLSGRPVIFSEWGFRGADVGMVNTGGVGRIVPTQDERGLRYAEFLEGIARHPNCVGSIYYAYVDDPPTGGGGIMKNENSNYGLVDVTDRPYEACVRHVIKANAKAENWHIDGPVSTKDITIHTPKDFTREPRDRFTVLRTGRVLGNEQIRAFLQGTTAGADHQVVTFEMDFAKPVRFAAKVYQVENAAALEFGIDGKVKRFELPAGRGHGRVVMQMPTGWQSTYDKEFSIRVPAGAHTVTVRNASDGWIWLDYYRIYTTNG